MAREIERKFLVEKPPKGFEKCPCSRIVQGYLPVGDGAFQIRLRRKDANRLLTIKCGRGRSRFEAGFPIPTKQFDSLWAFTAGARVSKRRYCVPVGNGFHAQLDVYQGKQRGLVTAEVEFASGKQSARFAAPQWFGREVTGHRSFENKALARNHRR